MAYTAGIDIEFATKNSLRKIIEIFVLAGWEYQFQNRICYVPHCSNILNWEQAPAAAWPEVFAILESKHARHEAADIVLYWKDTHCGCAFHVYPDGDVSLDFGSERVMLENCNSFTDVSWYLARTVCPLQKEGLRVETVRFSEIRTPTLGLAFEHPLSTRMFFGDDLPNPIHLDPEELAIR